MPELPEVETIRRDLLPKLVGRTIISVEVLDPFVLTGFSGPATPKRKVSVQDFAAQVSGKKIVRLSRRGKYLLWEFAEGGAVILHLRMTGQVLFRRPNYAPRLTFKLDSCETIFFCDRRRFGEVRFSPDINLEPDLARLGPEPFAPHLNPSYLTSAFRGKMQSVHAALLDQKIVAGVGNIYAAEALFASGIRPQRKAARVNPREIAELCGHLERVINQSIEHRGYSMRNYVDTLGKKGRSQMFSQVYGKENLPCPQCSAKLKRVVICGRSAVFCAECQK